MLDPTSPQDRAIAALMRLAESRPWREIFMADIAREAGLAYAELVDQFQCKADVLAAFVKRVDREVEERMAAKPSSDGPRDRLFDALMTRFDVLQPYRPALRRLTDEAPGIVTGLNPRVVARSLRSSLEAARIDQSGGLGCVKLAGLAGVYARTLRTWLEDDDPGQSRTMAKLDRQLRSGEQAIKTVEDICVGLARLADAFRKRRSGTRETPAPPERPA
ncbi:MAG: TetR/AcrR family transcriptional regulator [Hyphomicrobiaceae bacterium]